MKTCRPTRREDFLVSGGRTAVALKDDAEIPCFSFCCWSVAARRWSLVHYNMEYRHEKQFTLTSIRFITTSSLLWGRVSKMDQSISFALPVWAICICNFPVLGTALNFAQSRAKLIWSLMRYTTSLMYFIYCNVLIVHRIITLLLPRTRDAETFKINRQINQNLLKVSTSYTILL